MPEVIGGSCLPLGGLQVSADREKQVLRACQCGTPAAVKAEEKKHDSFLVVWRASPLCGPLLLGLLYGMPLQTVRVLASMSNGAEGPQGCEQGLGRGCKENFESLGRLLPSVPSIQTLDLKSSGCWGFPWQVATLPAGEV